MRRIVVALSFSAVVTAFMLACSSAEEATNSQSDEVRVRPDESDLPGKVVVVLPPGAPAMLPADAGIADAAAPGTVPGVEFTMIEWGSWQVKLGEIIDTGVDMPPGHYRVEIKYKTVEAGEKTDVKIIDVP